MTVDDLPSRLLLVRHPQSQFNLEGRWAGWVDAPLTVLGRSQAAEAAGVWGRWRLERLLSSDLRRASEAAALIAASLRLPHGSDPSWRERNAGAWQGRLVADLASDPAYAAWSQDFRLCPPDGEPYRMFADRLLQRLFQMLQGPARTLVVTHSGVLQALAAELGVPGASDWAPRPLLDALAVGADGSGRIFSADAASFPSTAASPTSPSLPGCFSCGLPRSSPSSLAWCSHLMMLSHTADEGRDGWFVLSPRRHVRSLEELTFAESDELLLLLRSALRVLSDRMGSRRTMVASLGWFVSDHLHLHLVPTFRPDVSYGSFNFDGAFLPWPSGREVAVQLMASELASDPLLGRLR